MVLSERVPVAVNASASPRGTLGFAGVTAIETTTAGLTVRAVVPLTPSSVAVMLEVPVPIPVARPAAVIVATEVVAEAQVTCPVTSWVDWSEKVPVAVKDSVLPLGTLGSAGVSAIEITTAGLTVSTAVPLMPSRLAVMFEVPVSTPVARPVASMVATAVVAEPQLT